MERTTHYLRGNKASRTPRRIFCLDSEAKIEVTDAHERHTLRVACCSFDHIDWQNNELKRSELEAFEDAADLWRWIEARTSPRERSVLWAHNLGYDLRLVGALVHLPALGWELKAFAIDSFRVWLRWAKDDRTLTQVDSMSFVAQALERFSADLGVTKPALPEQDDSAAAWLERCQADTKLLRALVLRLLGWLRANDCGDFRMTGAAQSSAAFRHRFLNGQRLLVHTNTEALVAERRAAWAGRCEVWQHGEIQGPLYEWDFNLAYARIAQAVSVPVELRGEAGSMSAQRALELSERYAVLAECDVATDVPIVPAEHEGHIVWPAGHFATTLWDNELRLAVAAGATVDVGRIWLYRRAPLLREWAEWIIERLQGEEQEIDPIGRRVLKLWARQLIGRFGLRYPRWEAIGETEKERLDYLPYVDVDKGTFGVFLACGRTVFEQHGKVEGTDSAPAVMSYIMAEARCRLWSALQTAGESNVIYCDTDSLIVTPKGNLRLEAATHRGEHGGLLWKGSHALGVFHGPRQVMLGSESRVAGLPKRAERLGGQRYQAVIWEGLKESLWQQHPEEVRLYQRYIELQGTDSRRRHLEGNQTAPFTLNGVAPGD